MDEGCYLGRCGSVSLSIALPAMGLYTIKRKQTSPRDEESGQMSTILSPGLRLDDETPTFSFPIGRQQKIGARPSSSPVGTDKCRCIGQPGSGEGG